MNVQMLSFDFAAESVKSYSNVTAKNTNNDSFDKLLNNSCDSKDNLISKASIDDNNKNNINSSQEADYHNKKLNTTRQTNTKDGQINNKEMPDEKQIIKNLVEKTGFSEEEIIEALDEAGLTAYDLLLQTNINIFLQKLVDVSSSIDLLSIPNINDLYKDIISVMDELKATYPILEDNLFNALEEQVNLFDNNDTEELNPKTTSNNSSQLENHEAVEKANDNNIINAEESLVENHNTGLNEEKFSFEFEKNDNSNTKKELKADEGFLKADNLNNPKEIILDNKNIVIQQSLESQLQKTDSLTDTLLGRQVNNLISPQDIMEQMVEHIKLNVSDNTSEINLQLKPDHLGKLDLKIVTERGIVTAQFIAENQAVKEIIESNFNQLRDVLQEQGLKVENLEVFVKQEFQNQHSHLMKEKSSKSNKRISNIISDFVSNPDEIYLDEVNNPYKRSESQIDFSA